MLEFKNILIAGAAGQGLATMGQLLAKSLMRGGYGLHVTQDYMSRIRGGHNTFAIRTGPGEPMAPVPGVDLLVALNQESVSLHKDELTEKGFVLLGESLDGEGTNSLPIPFKELAPKPIFQNVAALGAVAALLGLDRAIPTKLLGDVFGKKGQEIVDQNVEVLNKAYAWVEQAGLDFPGLPAAEPDGTRLMINGNEAIAMGAMAGGANFCSFYPMTPGTSVALNLIANSKKMGVVVEQAEDEIAAVNMALGAAYAGARAVVPTSGGGFALMTEGVSLAGMHETPLVLVLAQRPGPATGLPTRTEQGDLNLVLYAGHGEFPRAILAPGTVAQCFELGHAAMDLAERSQGPIFLLTDQYLADSFRAVPAFDLAALPEPARPLRDLADAEAYERYAEAESGASPRLIPGFTKGLVVADSDEHTADGHITEDLGVREAMQSKRLRKGGILKERVIAPALHGDKNPDTLLVCWGSTLGAALEAREALAAKGEKAAVLHFSQVYPLNPEQFLPALEAAKRTVCVEGNGTGQFAALVRQETGFAMDAAVLRFDGLPFTADYILERL